MMTRVLRILEDLIRIESVNPHFDKGAHGENGVARYIEQFCNDAGLTVSRQIVFDGRDNLIIELKTGHPDRVLLFEAHMDTVALGSMPNPLVSRYEAGRLYGRGACDTKGSLAAMLAAFEQCAREPELLACDLLLCASVDEEHAYRGLTAFMGLNLPINGAVVGEPTNLEIVVAHKGCTRFSVTAHGKAAHSSVPEEGVNAIVQMSSVINYLTQEIQPRLLKAKHPLCGSPTLSIGTIRGGSQINIVPEACTIEVDRRIIPGEDPVTVMQELKAELHEVAEKHGMVITVDELLIDWALNTPISSSIVESARKVAGAMGLNRSLCGATYGSDASKLQALKDIPSIVLGPGSIKHAHSIAEWVPVHEVELAAEFYLQLARQFGTSNEGEEA